MDAPAGAGAADDRLDFRMDAAGDFFRRPGGEVAVGGEVEGVEEALADIGVRLPEIDIEHVRSDVAGDGQQGAFDAFHLNARCAVQAHGEAGEVGGAVAVGGGGLARA